MWRSSVFVRLQCKEMLYNGKLKDIEVLDVAGKRIVEKECGRDQEGRYNDPFLPCLAEAARVSTWARPQVPHNNLHLRSKVLLFPFSWIHVG